MTSKLFSALGKRLPSKRVMAIGLVAVLLLFAGCSSGDSGSGEGTTVVTEEGGAETTVLQGDGGGTTVVTEEGGAETTIVTAEGTEMGTEMGTDMGTGMGTDMGTSMGTEMMTEGGA